MAEQPNSPVSIDSTDQSFARDVIDRSHELPVVVDFWADWCGPCRQLTPVLEEAVAALGGQVELVKVDVDANPRVAMEYRVQGIPAVKAFRDGRLVDQFTGALPRLSVETFLRSLLPSEADRLVEQGDAESIRRALELEPSHAGRAGRKGAARSGGRRCRRAGAGGDRRRRRRARSAAAAGGDRGRRRRSPRPAAAGDGGRVQRPRPGPSVGGALPARAGQRALLDLLKPSRAPQSSSPSQYSTGSIRPTTPRPEMAILPERG